ncbi:MAG: SPFH domain-containing protein, partial [Clostridia bacterium]|nr:SPFH domain-containing protein [Clostridia bacterium]
VSFGMNSVTANAEDEAAIKELQKTAVYRTPGMADALMAGARAEALKSAASNESGAMLGFMGMNLVNNAMGGHPQQPQYQQPQYQQQPAPAPAPVVAAAPAAAGWACSCGAKGNTGKFCAECGKPEPKPAAAGWDCSCGAKGNTGKFCAECGQPQPAKAEGWTCACGAVNKGKFCPECGAKKPAEAPLYRCDKCGWEPEDPKNPPKFCPECGDRFDDGDIK